jgi:hypothetical protein
MGRRVKHVGYWWEREKGRDHYERPKHRWVDNITTDIRETEWGGID